MRSLIAASTLVIFSMLSSAALAGKQTAYSSPGWYEVAESEMDIYLVAGPYGDQLSCQAQMLPDSNGYVDHCEYFAADPDFDF